MNAQQFIEQVGGAKFAIMLKTTPVVEAVAEMIKAGKIGEKIVSTTVDRQGLLISSADAKALKALLEIVADVGDGAEVIWRLTLEKLCEELADNYQECQVLSVKDRSDRNHEILLAKNGHKVTARMIIDPGIRKNVRVLAICLVPGSYQKYEVEAYAIHQFSAVSNMDEHIEVGDAPQFVVYDYDEEEFDGDNRSPFERCRDAVVMNKITGGAGDEKWVKDRANALIKNGQAKNQADSLDQAESVLNKSYEQFARALYAMTGTSISAAATVYPLEEYRPKAKKEKKEADFGVMFSDIIKG